LEDNKDSQIDKKNTRLIGNTINKTHDEIKTFVKWILDIGDDV
jgi:hypothetical protein